MHILCLCDEKGAFIIFSNIHVDLLYGSVVSEVKKKKLTNLSTVCRIKLRLPYIYHKDLQKKWKLHIKRVFPGIVNLSFVFEGTILFWLTSKILELNDENMSQLVHKYLNNFHLHEIMK